MPIGIFDSGIGGLTVFKEIEKNFPLSDIYYIGDTARVPYGNKSQNTIIRYSIELASFLIRNFNIDTLVVACNTASSFAMDKLKTYLNIPVIDVITPGVENAINTTKNKKIGIIGTQATIRSGSYVEKLRQKDKNIKIFSKACPLFVPLIEEGRLKGKITRLIIKDYLDPLVEKGIDTLILGCTHYPLLKEEILNLYPELNLVDSSNLISSYIKDFTYREKGQRRIFITDNSPAFKTLKNIIVPDIEFETVELNEICSL